MDINTDQSRALSRRFYALRFFDDLMLIYPVYIVLFLRSGLDLMEISLLLSIWCGSVVLTEVPTGALADRYSRRILLGLAAVSKTLGFVCWLFADGFWFFALGFILWGLSESLASGTLQSLLWDRLEALGQKDRYLTVVSRGSVLSKVATGIAMVVGGFLAAYRIEYVLWSSLGVMVLVTLIALGFREVRDRATPSSEQPYLATISQAARQVLRHGALTRLMLYSMVGLVMANFEEFDQAFRDEIGMPVAYFGFWSLGIMGSEAIGAYIAEKVFSLGKQRAKYLCTCLSGLALFVAGVYANFYILPIYALSSLAMSTAGVLVDAELQNDIESDLRATITSIHSLLMNAAAILQAILVGVLSTLGGLQLGMVVLALLVVSYGVLGWLLETRKA